MKQTPMPAIAAMLLAGTLSAQASLAREDDDADEDERETENISWRQQDRGPGVATSMFGTYVREGEWLLYTNAKYGRDDDFEYDPAEFGFANAAGEFFGQLRSREAAVVVAYGLDDDMVLELEAAAQRATLQKGPGDPSTMPAEIRESGLGDVHARLNWRVLDEGDRRPEVFTYVDLTIPHDSSKVLIGTADWVANIGAGAIRGFSWGTMAVRAGALFELSSASVGDWGEVAVEYYKRLSPQFALYTGLIMAEGDEGSAIAELQWHVTPHMALKINSGFALTSHAVDWAPQIGVQYSFAPK